MSIRYCFNSFHALRSWYNNILSIAQLTGVNCKKIRIQTRKRNKLKTINKSQHPEKIKLKIWSMLFLFKQFRLSFNQVICVHVFLKNKDTGVKNSFPPPLSHLCPQLCGDYAWTSSGQNRKSACTTYFRAPCWLWDLVTSLSSLHFSSLFSIIGIVTLPTKRVTMRIKLLKQWLA